jgi:large subunit ribosomal protein L9
MAAMFDRGEAGFTEDRDPNAEPGEIPADTAETTGGDGEASSEA